MCTLGLTTSEGHADDVDRFLAQESAGVGREVTLSDEAQFGGGAHDLSACRVLHSVCR